MVQGCCAGEDGGEVERIEAGGDDIDEHHRDAGPFKRKSVVRVHRDRVHSVAVRGNHFASASWDGTVKVYSLPHEKVVQTLGQPKSRWGAYVKQEPREREGEETMHGLYAVSFAKTSPDILGCVSGKDDNGTVHLWDYSSGVRVLQLDGHSEDANSIDFHQTQNIVVTGSDDCTAKVWDFSAGRELRTLEDHEKEVYGTCFLGQAMEFSVATCSFDRLVRVFDMRDASVSQKIAFHRDDVIGITFSEEKHLLATGGDDGLIGLHDIRTWQCFKEIDTRAQHEGCEVKRVAFDSTGSSLAAACSNCSVLVFDTGTAQEVACLRGHEDCCFDVAWGEEEGSQGKRILVSAAHDATSCVWVER